MINKLSVVNYQSHEQSELNLDPGVNIIIGSSDEGKSVIMRTFDWVINNRPLGIAYVSWWNIDEKENIKKSTRVTIEIDNNIIIRERNNNFNGYIVNGEKYEALKFDVPEEVKRILNFSDVNIQKQFDRPFLLDDSAGEVAKFFNEIIKIDDIDKMLALVEKKKRKTKSDLKYKKEEQVKIENDLNNLNWIKDVEVLLKKAERIENRIKEDEDKYNNLNDLISDYKETEKRIIDIDFDKINSKINEVEKIESVIKEDEKQYSVLSELVNEYYSIKDRMSIYNMIEDVHGKIEEVNVIENKLGEINNKHNLLKKLVDDYYDLEKSISKNEKDIEELKKQYPELCPLCGNKLNKEGE